MAASKSARKTRSVEEVELQGHIIDSLLLPKVLDEILTCGGNYTLKDIRLGKHQVDPSYARLEVRADNAQQLEDILAAIHDHGAVPVDTHDCEHERADMDGAFPERFYSTTNYRTQVRRDGDWLDVQDQEMDCGIVLDLDANTARCIPMVRVSKGDAIVVGRHGLRVIPAETAARHTLFEFMASAVSSEKPKGVTVREIAAAMRRSKEAGEKILAVLGPAVVHTGSVEHVCTLIRSGYLHILFAGNALATHDIEQALYDTSLGVWLDRGLPAEEGHEHHLRAINTIRRLGGIKAAVAKGVLKSGIMYECVQHDVPFVLAGSIRDDGPLPDVITDVLVAQDVMREHIRKGVGFCLMISTMLHSIATGNLLPAWVKVACVDINPATVTKLADRGSHQTVGVVTDAEPFLRSLLQELESKKELAMSTPRTAQIRRETAETKIALELNLDGSGKSKLASGVGFFDHMLTLLSRHSLIDLTVEAQGDLHVDAHHTVEDVGICFGLALRQALGDKAGIRRYGHAILPMDEALVTSALDLSGRAFCVWQVDLAPELLGTFNTALAEEFWRAVVGSGLFNLHVLCHHGRNAHHIIEAVFKATARALRQAVEFDPRNSGVPSTKGVL